MGAPPASLAHDLPSNVCYFTLRLSAFASDSVLHYRIIYGWSLAKALRRKDRKERTLHETIDPISPARRFNAENANSCLRRDDLSAGCGQCLCRRDNSSHGDLRQPADRCHATTGAALR